MQNMTKKINMQAVLNSQLSGSCNAKPSCMFQLLLNKQKPPSKVRAVDMRHILPSRRISRL